MTMGAGLRQFFEMNDKGIVYLRKAPEMDLVIDDPELPPYVGLDKAVLAEYADRIRYVEDDTEVLPGAVFDHRDSWQLSETHRRYPSENAARTAKCCRIPSSMNW